MLINCLNFVNPLSMYSGERCLASAPPFNQRAIAVNITTDKVTKKRRTLNEKKAKAKITATYFAGDFLALSVVLVELAKNHLQRRDCLSLEKVPHAV